MRLPRFLSGPSAAPTAAAVLAGLLAAAGQAPWGLWPLSLAGFALLTVLVARAPSRRAAFARGWWAGTAHFALAMVWIVEPFLVDAPATGWMAPIALPMLAGGLALFWAGAGLFAAGINRRPRARVWLFALAMLAFEDLRGWIFTGLPWVLSGHIWVGLPPDQLAALGGALLLSALTLGLSAALASAWLLRRARLRAGLVLGGALAVALAAWGWGAARLAQPLPEGPGLRLRLVQPNIAQADKWRDGLVEANFWRHLELSAAPAEIRPDLVIWPETAAPFLLDRPGTGLLSIAEAAGAPVLLGIQRREIGEDGFRRYFNSMALIDRQGIPRAVYDKHHLVPFGEYVPLIGDWAERQGFGGFAARILSGYTPGPGPAVMDLAGEVPGGGLALPLICYEAVFPRELRGTERPGWIVQITNDAWFGASAGPRQHFAQARLRAIEQGLPLVRAANTGISAVIDARGRVLAALGLGEAGALDADLPGALPATPYARRGDAPWHWGLALAVLGGLLGSALGRRVARRGPRESN